VARSWKYVRRSNEIATKPSNRSAVVLGCTVGLLAMAFHSVTDFNMHLPANALVAVTLMAILASHLRFATERFWINPGVFGRILASLLLLGAGAYFVWQLSRLGPQTWTISQYFQPLTFEQRVDLLQRAYAFEPGNSAVTIEIGEVLRKKGFEGDEGWEKQIRAAIPWFERGIELNRWNPFNYMNLGMCYHKLKEPAKATEYFEKAIELDPKGYQILRMYGWHKLQLGDLQAAQKYFRESYTYCWENNDDAKTYLEIVERRLAESAQTR
jgi:hypothetical protein